MAIRPIELYGSPVLKEVAKPVEAVTPEVLELLDKGEEAIM